MPRTRRYPPHLQPEPMLPLDPTRPFQLAVSGRSNLEDTRRWIVIRPFFEIVVLGPVNDVLRECLALARANRPVGTRFMDESIQSQLLTNAVPA